METIYTQNVPLLVFGLFIFICFCLITYTAWLAALAGRNSCYPLAFFFTNLQLLVTTIVLGLTGLLNQWFYFGTNLLVSIVLIYNNKDQLAVISRSFVELRRIVSNSDKASLLVLTVLLGGVFLRVTRVAVFNLPSVGDDLFYHLPQLFDAVVEEKIRITGSLAIWQDFYPKNFDLLYLPVLLWFKTDNFFLLFNVILTFAGYLLVGYSICRNFAGRYLSIFGGLLLFLIPAVAHGSLTGYVDHLVNLFYLFGFFFLIEIWKKPGSSLLHLGFILNMALLLGGKYSSAYALIFFTAAYAAMWVGFIKTKKVVIGGLLSSNAWLVIVFIAVCFLIGPVWHIRNYKEYGNPFAPQTISFFGNELFSAYYPDNTIFDQDKERFDQARTNGGNYDLGSLFGEDRPTDYRSVLATYYAFPSYYLLNHNNQLGPLWSFVLLPSIFLGVVWALFRKKYSLLAIIVGVIILYLLHPIYLLQTTRYTSFISLAGVAGLVYALSTIRLIAIARLTMIAVVLFGIFHLNNLPIAEHGWLKKTKNAYLSGEYFSIDAEPGSYLYCYDFIRLRISGKKITYINTGLYPYTYHLYGKGLTNRVSNYPTLDPVKWKEKVLSNRVDIVVLLSNGLSKTHKPILEMLKTDPAFKALRHVEPHYEDDYNTCRWDFVYKVQYF